MRERYLEQAKMVLGGTAKEQVLVSKSWLANVVAALGVDPATLAGPGSVAQDQQVREDTGNRIRRGDNDQP